MGKEEVQKNYTVTSSDEKGQVQISNEVVTIIAGLAATEVKGVASMVGNITNELVSKLGIKNLSKGYKQRVGLAQAIIGYPEVIILDEPTVGLDPKQIIEIRELIKELAKKHTIILSSHILSEVSAVCDHIMIISKGKLVASDTPEGLMALLKGGRQMKLSVLGEQYQVEELLKNIEQIKDFSFQPPKSEGWVSVNIRTEDTQDIRVELFHRLAAADLPIMELSLSEKSLEDVFLELTGEEEKENEGNI